MAEITTLDYPNEPDFVQVWTTFKETGQRFKETGQILKEFSRQIDDLQNSFGEITDHLVAPGIADRFNELGYKFDAFSPGGHRILDDLGKIKTEIGIILENGRCVMAVEVKTEPKLWDIYHHIKRLEILREHRNKHNDKRVIQGAIAGTVFGSMEKQAVLEAGLYVIELSEGTIKLEFPDGFVPGEW